MGEAEGEVQHLALDGRLEADALDLQLLGEAVGDAFDVVGEQAAEEAVQGTVLALLAAVDDREDVVFQAGAQGLGQLEGGLALGAFDFDFGTADGDLDAFGNGDGLISYARHGVSL